MDDVSQERRQNNISETHVEDLNAVVGCVKDGRGNIGVCAVSIRVEGTEWNNLRDWRNACDPDLIIYLCSDDSCHRGSMPVLIHRIIGPARPITAVRILHCDKIIAMPIVDIPVVVVVDAICVLVPAVFAWVNIDSGRYVGMQIIDAGVEDTDNNLREGLIEEAAGPEFKYPDRAETPLT